MKKLALFDFDNTLYKGLSIVDIAKQQAADSLLPKETFSQIENLVAEYRQGIREYETTVRLLLEAWASGLAGEQYAVAVKTAQEVLRKPQALFEFVPQLLDELRETHALYLITGSPNFTAEASADLLNFDGYYASEFTVEKGKFTGELDAVLADREEKLGAVSKLLDQYGKEGSLAFGDSEGDIAMLETVEIPFGVNVTEGLREHGAERSWHLETPDTICKSVQAILK